MDTGEEEEEGGMEGLARTGGLDGVDAEAVEGVGDTTVMESAKG